MATASPDHDRDRPIQPLGLLVKVFPKLSETFILEEVLGLERLGVPLQLYTLGPPTDAVQHPAVQRVRASITEVPAQPWPGLASALRAHLAALAARPLGYARALLAALRRGSAGWGDLQRALWLAARLRADGVPHLHTHFISQPADIAMLVAQLGGLPFSLSAHAKDIYLGQPEDLGAKLRAARFTVTCTEFNCQTLRRIAPDAPVHRMYHGIDGGAFHPSHRHRPSLVPLILSVGRLRAKKGLDTLIQACALLLQRGQPFRCEIVGYGEEQARLQALIDSLNLTHLVTLVGKLTREHVIDRYARAAVYVQPSRVTADGDRDGIPNVLLEAMAMALPVVATNVSGIPELVQHMHNGLLTEPDDPTALADAISRLIDQPLLSARLGTAGRQAVITHFDNDRNLQLVLQLLEHRHVHTQACAA